MATGALPPAMNDRAVSHVDTCMNSYALEESMIRSTTTGGHGRLHRLGLAAVALGMLTLAGCSAGAGATSTGTTAGGSATVTVHNAAGHADVLATADGRTLYLSDQENGTVRCTGSECTAVWLPLTVAADTTPTGPSQLSGMLGTLKRPDGKAQVTLEGKPLYTFSLDHGPSEVGGDNQKDSFDGTDFTWHVATAGGMPAPSGPQSPSSGGYSY
jgi:predicted lipoprotein with Yx(FWY)xxD motif